MVGRPLHARETLATGGSSVQVEEWLAEIGMSQYIDAFHKERITIDVVSTLTYEDLKKLGVRTLGDR